MLPYIITTLIIVGSLSAAILGWIPMEIPIGILLFILLGSTITVLFNAEDNNDTDN